MAESRPVYIGKLIFEDYHSFKGHNVLDLMDKEGHLYQWTVFLGNNNTGKTNILKAIANLEATIFIDLKESYQGQKERYTTLFSINKYINNNTEKFFRISAEIYSNDEQLDLEHKNIFEINPKKINSHSAPFNKPFWFYGNNFWKAEQIDLLENFKIFGYGVTRRTSNNGISEKSEELNAASLFNSEDKLTNIEEWLFQLKFASQNERPAAGQRLQLLKEIIKSEILPEILDFKFTTTEELRNYIEYQTKEGWFLFEQLGYGYQATMSWIIDLCKKLFERYPYSPNPLKEPAIVLVDELDLHLHPKWQKTIVDYLTKTFTSTQFIVTTHSPLILQTIEKVNLFALIKTEDRVNIRHIPNQSLEGWSVEEILRDVMDMDERVYSDKYNEWYKEFDSALDSENYELAKAAYDKLLEILHPTSPERKILKLQLSQIAPVNDKA